jgi:4-hydroxybenzoyl-CoA thioesterase
MSDGTPFVVDKTIRFHHCDPAGIVFYPQYFVLMNELVEDWFNAGLRIDFGRFHAVDGLTIPMAHVECDFLAPSGVGDVLRFSLAVARIGTKSLTLAVEATCSGQARIRASLVLVLASRESRTAVPLAPELRARIARFTP